MLQQGLIVGTGNGKSTSFWYHHWIGHGPLYKIIKKDIPDNKARWFVCNIIRIWEWFLDDIHHLLLDDIKKEILAYPLCRNVNDEDLIRWNYSKNGKFTIKSACHLLTNTASHSIPNPFVGSRFGRLGFRFKY